MANATEVISAIRELSSTKQLDRTEMIELLKDGLHAALVKRYFEARQAHTARIVADRTSPSAVAVRNRAIKTLLEDEYGKGNVKVTGDRGTAYGWVNVRINAPGPKGEAEKNGIERKILKAGIKLGHYDSGDYGSGYELSVRFGQENA